MAKATICDYCGNLVNGDVARVTEEIVGIDQGVLTSRVDATTEEYHPECRAAVRALIDGARPAQAALPDATPNLSATG